MADRRWRWGLVYYQMRDLLRGKAVTRSIDDIVLRGVRHCTSSRYELDTDTFDDVANCHCTICRRTTGATMATGATVPIGAFRWTAIALCRTNLLIACVGNAASQRIPKYPVVRRSPPPAMFANGEVVRARRQRLGPNVFSRVPTPTRSRPHGRRSVADFQGATERPEGAARAASRRAHSDCASRHRLMGSKTA